MTKVYVDAVRGEMGEPADWVDVFARLWRLGRASQDRFMDLMGPRIRLVAPGLRVTEGREAGTAAFRRTFELFPDLTAEVLRWSASDDCIFIEMTFAATIGGRRVQWRNVDRVLFRDGYAVERVAYFNPLGVRRALLRSPSGWWILLARLFAPRGAGARGPACRARPTQEDSAYSRLAGEAHVRRIASHGARHASGSSRQPRRG